jgi:hypothetical protein
MRGIGGVRTAAATSAAAAIAIAAVMVVPGVASAATPAISSVTVTANPIVGHAISFTIKGDTFGPDQYGLSQYTLVMVARPASGPPCSSSDFVDGNRRGLDPVVGYDWNLQNVDGPFTESRTYVPFDGHSSQSESPWSTEIYPGSYRVCAWLDDQQATNPAVSDALATSTLTVLPAKYTLKLRAPRSIRIGSVVERNLQFQTFTFKAGGQTTAHRVIEFAAQPPGVKTCAPDLGASRWNKLEENPNFYKSSGEHQRGIPLRPGTHTYKAKLGLAAEEGATPGRTLVCAAIYDTTESLDFADHIKVSQPDGLQALAHAFIDVKPLPS